MILFCAVVLLLDVNKWEKLMKVFTVVNVAVLVFCSVLGFTKGTCECDVTLESSLTGDFTTFICGGAALCYLSDAFPTTPRSYRGSFLLNLNFN